MKEFLTSNPDIATCTVLILIVLAIISITMINFIDHCKKEINKKLDEIRDSLITNKKLSDNEFDELYKEITRTQAMILTGRDMIMNPEKYKK